MSIRHQWLSLGDIQAVRTGLFFLGWLLIATAPVLGVLPGPGGLIVFAAGAGLVLKYSAWAKRKYVLLKRRYPRKVAWADWGMRRKSALRRQARDRQRLAADSVRGD